MEDASASMVVADLTAANLVRTAVRGQVHARTVGAGAALVHQVPMCLGCRGLTRQLATPRFPYLTPPPPVGTTAHAMAESGATDTRCGEQGTGKGVILRHMQGPPPRPTAHVGRDSGRRTQDKCSRTGRGCLVRKPFCPSSTCARVSVALVDRRLLHTSPRPRAAMFFRARLRNPCPCSRSGLLSWRGRGLLPRMMGRTMWSYPLRGPHFPLDPASFRGETLVDWACGHVAVLTAGRDLLMVSPVRRKRICVHRA